MASDVTSKAPGPLWKPKKHRSPASRRNRLQLSNDSRWSALKKEFKAKHVQENGWYICDTSQGYGCGRWFQYIEVDHVIKRSVRPDLKYEEGNLQLLCHDCHMKKDGGMNIK